MIPVKNNIVFGTGKKYICMCFPSSLSSTGVYPSPVPMQKQSLFLNTRLPVLIPQLREATLWLEEEEEEEEEQEEERTEICEYYFFLKCFLYSYSVYIFYTIIALKCFQSCFMAIFSTLFCELSQIAQYMLFFLDCFVHSPRQLCCNTVFRTLVQVIQ